MKQTYETVLIISLINSILVLWLIFIIKANKKSIFRQIEKSSIFDGRTRASREALYAVKKLESDLKLKELEAL
jgi:hypothetical protein